LALAKIFDALREGREKHPQSRQP